MNFVPPLKITGTRTILRVKYKIRTSQSTAEFTPFHVSNWDNEADVTNSPARLISEFWRAQLFCSWIPWQSKHTAVGTDTVQIQSLCKSCEFSFRGDACFISLNKSVLPQEGAWNTQCFKKKKVAVLYSFDEGYNTSLSSLHVSIHSH